MIWLTRCRLAMWLEGLKSRIDRVADLVDPGEEGWRKYEERERKTTTYWENKNSNPQGVDNAQ